MMHNEYKLFAILSMTQWGSNCRFVWAKFAIVWRMLKKTALDECGIDCGEHGSCTPDGAACICHSGYTGQYCQQSKACRSRFQLLKGFSNLVIRNDNYAFGNGDLPELLLQRHARQAARIAASVWAQTCAAALALTPGMTVASQAIWLPSQPTVRLLYSHCCLHSFPHSTHNYYFTSCLIKVEDHSFSAPKYQVILIKFLLSLVVKACLMYNGECMKTVVH